MAEKARSTGGVFWGVGKLKKKEKKARSCFKANHQN